MIASKIDLRDGLPDGGALLLFFVGRCCLHPWIKGIRNLCKLFIHFKHCRKSLFITFRHSETSDGGGVRGFVSIACVCILQSVSRVAHVNDYIEDQSERNLT